MVAEGAPSWVREILEMVREGERWVAVHAYS
jgi:hypothetical protein